MMANSFKGSEPRDAIIAPENRCSQLVNSINQMLDEIQPLSSKYCIYRVPPKIRKLNEEAYDPRVISIGPFHYGDERFRSMEALKKRFFKKVIQRNTGVGLENYIEFLKNSEYRIRQCYSETIEMDSEKFVTLMLVDGCFLIDLLICTCYGGYRDADSSFIFGNFSLWNDINFDLLLLENQLPFFVLEGLLDLAMTSFKPIPLLDLTLFYFKSYNVQEKQLDSKSIDHFTELILILYRPVSPRIVKKIQYTTSATELNEAGVKFKMGSSNCLLDIKFSNGTLEIPRIKLYDDTESLFRNLMALELRHHLHDSYLTDYFLFMDFLINTSKDVDLLVQGGIIESWLGDNEQVANLFNKLSKHNTIRSDNFYFSSLCEDLNAFCKVPRHKWKAVLKRDYFSSPWRSASTSAAIVLLVLTFIQTVCSIIGAAKGK